MPMGGTIRTAGALAQSRAWRPSSAGTTPSDPSGVLASFSVAEPGTFSRFGLENPTTISLDPDDGASVSLGRLRNVAGNESEYRLGDPMRVRIWAEQATPPADVVIWGVATYGPLSATSYGFGCALRYNVLGWELYVLRNQGAGWLHSVGSGVSGATRGAEAHAVLGSSHNVGRVGAVALDASGLPCTGAVHRDVLNTTAFNDPLTHLTIGAGWVSGVGGSPGVVGVSGLVVLADLASVAEAA